MNNLVTFLISTLNSKSAQELHSWVTNKEISNQEVSQWKFLYSYHLNSEEEK